MYKIAIVGAATLLGKELKDALTESSLAAADFALFDEDEGLGQLDQLGDEVTFVQGDHARTAFEHVDFTFFCGSESLTRRFWREALRAGSTVLDLSGALDQEAGVLVRSPWVGAQDVAADLFTPAVVPAHPAALALALLMERLQQAAPVRSAAATVLLPASEFGRAAMDELHQQTVNLLSFQTIPRATFDAQSAYNLLSGFGENAKVSMTAIDAQDSPAIQRAGRKTAAGAGDADDQCAGLSRSRIFDLCGTGAAGGFVGAGRRIERRSCRPGARGYGFAFESGGYRAERCAGAAAAGAGAAQCE